jgi:hypothetical protein
MILTPYYQSHCGLTQSGSACLGTSASPEQAAGQALNFMLKKKDFIWPDFLPPSLPKPMKAANQSMKILIVRYKPQVPCLRETNPQTSISTFIPNQPPQLQAEFSTDLQ